MAESHDPRTEAIYQEAMAVLQRLAGASARPGVADPPHTEMQTTAVAAIETFTRPPQLADWGKDALWSLIETLPDALLVVNNKGQILLCNKRTEEIFGYAREELLGKPVEVLVPERSRNAHHSYRQTYFEKPLSRPMGAGLELYGQRKDGGQVPVEISLSPLQTDFGAVVISVIRDVSPYKKETAKLRTLVENIPAVTFIAPLDESSPELYVSPQIEEMLGFTQKEWLEDPVLWHKQLHPDDKDRWNHQFAPVCSTGESFQSVYRFIAKDGHVVWVHGAASLVRNDNGEPFLLQGVAFEITAIKEAEETLREQARLYALEAAVSSTITKVHSLKGMLQECTEAVVQHLDAALARLWTVGEDQQSLELQASAGLSTPVDSAYIHVPFGTYEIGRVAQEAKARFADDVGHDPRFCGKEWVRREGMRTFVSYPLIVDGQLVGVLALFSRNPVPQQTLQSLELVAANIGLCIKRKQAEEELERRVEQRTEELNRSLTILKEQSKELERSNKELDQFAYSASHDLKEPLRAIKSLARFIDEDAGEFLPEDSREDLALMKQRIDRLERLLDDLLAYSRVGRVSHQVEEVDTAVLVQELVQLGGVPASFNIVVSALPTIVTEKTPLEQVLRNLISNAVKHHDRPDGRIEVSASETETVVEFVVRDDGPGIPPEYHQKVFQLFQKLKSRDRVEGSGMGLALVQKIVENHGGTITLESEPDQGATFRFTWPKQTHLEM